ncbi:MAG TPA: hypothetical protein PKG54_14765 [Phycisphaerae bacterium]|jgi:hypothetical protein|nr:hypothetical protein [Phycisphaerae bacterium]HOJ55591.1 hypothetical protein [Phycisphaerae bacterium]HOL27713.1 hypothetical protein [Phycisphaerae bacterium]HPP21905.1 hypothetical protein [Phycisphaerae bacterium]HPU32500.1 hypothetical protein [Phycisphaerae bacterium]
MLTQHDNPTACLANGRNSVPALVLFSFSWWFYFDGDRRLRA